MDFKIGYYFRHAFIVLLLAYLLRVDSSLELVGVEELCCDGVAVEYPSLQSVDSLPKISTTMRISDRAMRYSHVKPIAGL